MVTGFKFKAKKGMLYLLQFTDNGDNHKLISMMMSTTVIYNDNIAGKDDMTNATRKIGKISN